jgi:hypothetical protein
MRYISWPATPSPHPNVLRLRDLERITASGAFLARKFDERTDHAVLPRYPPIVLRRAGPHPLVDHS